MNQELIEVVHKRLNPHIDPSLHVWGWEIPVYLFLGGIVAGVMILLPALELARREQFQARSLRAMPFVSLGLLGVGMGALFLDLAYKAHVLRFYTSFQPTSAMSWGSWILLLVVPALLLFGLANLGQPLREKITSHPRIRSRERLVSAFFAWLDSRRSTILRANIVLGISVGVYTGLLLGAAVARVPWNSAILGPLFLTSGISTAAAFLLLLRIDDRTRHALVKVDIIAILLELVFLGALLLAFQTGSAGAQAGASLFLGGAYTAPFWGLVVMSGLLVPLLLNWIEIKKHISPTIMSPALVLIGGFALRAVLVAAGQSISFGDF